jgi:hypothetical protein
MPALKPRRFDTATRVLDGAALTVAAFRDAYLASPIDALPLAELRAQLVAAYASQTPAVDVDTRRPRVHEIAEAVGLLPSSTPYAVVAVIAEDAVLDPLQHQLLQIRMTATDGSALLDASMPLSSLLHRQVTLAYQAAAVEDQALLDRAGSLLDVPLYLLRLRPVVLVDGRVIAVGTGTIAAGDTHRAEVIARGPHGEQAWSQQLLAGGVAALGIDAQDDRATPPSADTPLPAEAQIGRAARVLGHYAAAYATAWNEADRELADHAGVTVLRPLPALTLVMPQYRVTSSLGLAQSLQFDGVVIDALARPVEPIAHNTAAHEADFLRLSRTSSD